MQKNSGNIVKKQGKKNKENTWSRDFKRNWQLYIMILTPLAYILVFKFYPMYGAQIAFRNYVPTLGIEGSEWVEFDNFKRFFNNSMAMQYVCNTLALSIYSMVISFPLQIIFAIGLNYVRSRKFKKTVQMVSYLPHFISTVIIISMLNMMFDNRIGVMDKFLELILGKEISVMGNPDYFRTVYVWSGVWQNLGWSSILFISALAGVDPSLHEAAMIDGANKWQRVWHIDLMCILPTIAITFIMNFGRILSVGFDKAFLMQNATNLRMSEILSTYEYKIGLGGTLPAYSYSAAIGLMSSVVTFILVITVNKITKKFTETGLW